MDGDSLRLVAIYGAVSGCAVLLFGVVIGDWIDRVERLKAAQITLIVQNSCVIICTLGLFTYFHFYEEIAGMLNGQLPTILKVVFIGIAVVADLGSVGRKIAVERDWTVMICGGNKDRLAKMTSIMRVIDQSSKILAPVLTGQILTFASVEIGGLFVAGWNAVSVFVEYFFLWKVYQLVPSLNNKKIKSKARKNTTTDVPQSTEAVSYPPDYSRDFQDEKDVVISASRKLEQEGIQPSTHCCATVLSAFIDVYKGWGTYIRYEEAYAGLGLALLYMTVLGFDNITVAYGYTQGLSAAAMSGLVAGAGAIGILGAVAYPSIRRSIGLERTGLYALAEQITFLSFCVVSIWMPGSPFDPFYFLTRNDSLSTSPSRDQRYNFENTTNKTPDHASWNVTRQWSNITLEVEDCGTIGINISVIMFFVALILARFGLWSADLTITQIFMEKVDETERGVVNGVQESINKLMDILKFILVIILPQPEVFGFLIIISFLFVCCGAMSFCIYSRKKRGHFLPHFCKYPLGIVNNRKFPYVTYGAI